MNGDLRRLKASRDNRLLDPENHVVARPSLVVAEVVIEAQFFDRPRFQQSDDFVGPVRPDPSVRRRSFVVQEDAHDSWQVARRARGSV